MALRGREQDTHTFYYYTRSSARCDDHALNKIKFHQSKHFCVIYNKDKISPVKTLLWYLQRRLNFTS
ncbi:hypothetical protein PsorP6_000762 [Peronosclerospora sorghi]|uniref:Uncharacterized protein n=1 Tax=Peronosclerospora sorghi TaxID=230839 RepID=A0ACC0WRU7_9STRA|nr:hypothetical protein PsorP6_000762 [Peronosclerospora sorghi]